jgi:hypothetical protein
MNAPIRVKLPQGRLKKRKPRPALSPLARKKPLMGLKPQANFVQIAPKPQGQALFPDAVHRRAR